MTTATKSLYILLMIFFAVISLLSAGAQATEPPCVLRGTTEQFKGQAIIFGDDAEVPTIHLRFLDAAHGKSLSPKSVDVHYYWQWLEYPYPEHTWGAWSDGEDWVKCNVFEGRSDVSIPKRTVKPRGWYDGKYVHFPLIRKPRFDRVEIVIERDGYSQRLLIQSRSLEKYKDSVATLNLSTEPPSVSFSKR